MTLPTPSEKVAIAAVHDSLLRLVADRGRLGLGLSLRVDVADPKRNREALVEVHGDTDGLLHLAMFALRVAMADHGGHHEHIDRASFADDDSIPLIISRIEQFD